MESQLKQITHTKELHKVAKNKEAHSKSILSQKPVDAQAFKMLLREDQWPSLSMLEDGLTTHLVFSVIVEKTSITQFCWLVSSMEPGKSRIHGEVHGVKKDLSDLPQVTLAVFVKKQACILTDFIPLDLSQFSSK